MWPVGTSLVADDPYPGVLMIFLGLRSLVPNLFWTLVSWFFVELGKLPMMPPLLAELIVSY